MTARPTFGWRVAKKEKPVPAGPRADAPSHNGRKTVNKLNNQRGGFTLIELMIVVAIIGILAAIAIPNFLRFQLKAKSSEGKVNLAAIRTAEESYYAEYGGYVSSEASPQATAANVAPTSKAQSAGIMDDELECRGTAGFSDGSDSLSIPGIN